MKALGQYDSDVQMFVEEPATLNQQYLLFWQWLVQNKQCEDDIQPSWKFPHYADSTSTG